MTDLALEKLQEGCRSLRESKQTLLLATQGQRADLSYAPFVEDKDGRFYIYVSELAGHTQNLLQNAELSVMFIADEQESKNLFARERLIFSCRAEEVALDHPVHEVQLNHLQKKFGNIIEMLRSLPDFHLFRLVPEQGRYIVGFGRAYNVEAGTGELTHIDESVLKEKKKDNA